MEHYKVFWMGWLIVPVGILWVISWTLIKISANLAIIATALSHMAK